jgi:hypothetical protein
MTASQPSFVDGYQSRRSLVLYFVRRYAIRRSSRERIKVTGMFLI